MKTLESLVRKFVEGHPQDAANALEQIDVAEAVRILDRLPFRLNGLLIERLKPQKAGAILERLDPIVLHLPHDSDRCDWVCILLRVCRDFYVFVNRIAGILRISKKEVNGARLDVMAKKCYMVENA